MNSIEVVPLGSIVNIIGGGTPSKAVAEYWDGDIAWASIRDMKERFLSSTELGITEKGLKSSSSHLIPSGHVVIASRVGLGKVVQVEQDTAINQDLRGLVPKDPNSLSNDFLYYWGLFVAPQIVAAGSGATVQGVRLDFLKGLMVPKLSLEKQKSLVEYLDLAFAELEILESQVAIQESRIAELTSSIIGQILSSMHGIEGLDCTLGEICDIDWGNTKLTKKSYVSNGNFAAVAAAGVDGRINHAEHKANTPVLSAIGANCGRMFFPTEDFTAIKNTITLTPHSGKVTGAYLYRLLQAIELPKRGAGQPFISKGDIQKFKVRILPFEKQDAAISAVDSALDEISSLEAAYETKKLLISELRESVLHKSFGISS